MPRQLKYICYYLYSTLTTSEIWNSFNKNDNVNVFNEISDHFNQFAMPPRNDVMFGPAAPLNSEELPSIKEVICFAKHVQDNLPHHCKKLSDSKIGMHV